MKTCVILAGGKSSRMGCDKALLPFGGFPTLTHYQFDKFSKLFTNVFISSKFDKFEPKLPIIKDINEHDFSPMLALFSVLSNFDNESVFIISADMPFVTNECIRTLYQYKSDFDMVVAKDDEHTHSLCGFFHSSLAQKIDELYKKDEHKIGSLQNFCPFKVVNFKDSKQFFNVNYPDEYQIALKMENQ